MLPLALLLALPNASPPAPTAPTNAPVAQAAHDPRLEGVVLLLRTTSDDKLGFGAGVLLDDTGLVLTALHVVADGKALHALTYDANAPIYTAADGGIGRVWFERARDLKDVEIVRGDPTSDLAVVRIKGPLPKLARLSFAKDAPKSGDAVVAVGHPAGNAWSFSQGLAGAPRASFVQHSARLAPGSSGGPLLNERGEVVGINVLNVEEGGASLARPANLAHALVGDVVAPLAMNRSTPADAARSCAHAREVGSDAWADCTDWSADADAIIASFAAGLGGARPETLAWLKTKRDRIADLFRAQNLALEHDENDIASWDRHVELQHLIEDASRAGKPIPPGKKPVLVAVEMRVDPNNTDAVKEAIKRIPAIASEKSLADFLDEVDPEALAKNGLKAAPNSSDDVRALLHMGLRVDAVVTVDPDHAWVAQSGRNLDGSVYRFTSYWHRVDGGYRETVAPSSPPSPLPPLLWGATRTLDMQAKTTQEAGAATKTAGPAGVMFQMENIDYPADFTLKNGGIEITPKKK